MTTSPDPLDAAAGTPSGAIPEATHVLGARVTLPQAEAFLEELRGGMIPVIDARAVEEIPAAYVLVLTALIRAHAAEGGGDKIRVLAPSPAFVDAFSDLGLFQDLMKMEFCQ